MCQTNAEHRLVLDLAHHHKLGHTVLLAMSRTTPKEPNGITALPSISPRRIREHLTDSKRHGLLLELCRLH
jgi:hypothetical protein